MIRIDFEPLRPTHIVALCRWLNHPPVLEWYARRPKSIVEVAHHYGRMMAADYPTRGFLVRFDGEPAGFLKTYRIDSYPVYFEATNAEPTWAGLDYFIGEQRFYGRGLGPRMVRAFVEQVVFAMPGIDGCISGPDPRNVRSIRTLERAGFSFWCEVDDVHDMAERVLLLRKSESRREG